MLRIQTDNVTVEIELDSHFYLKEVMLKMIVYGLRGMTWMLLLLEISNNLPR